MRIVDQGRQRDYETGEPVDRVVLEDSEYEEVAVRQINDETAVVTFRTTDGEAENLTFEITKQRFLGITPVDQEFGSLPAELRTVLNYIGFAEVADTDSIEGA